MHRLRLLFVFVAVVAVTCVPALAHAQSITSSDPTRITAQSDPQRPDNQNPLGISYADCVADMTLQFAAQLSGFTGSQSMQVWASLGSTCAAQEDRGLAGGTAVCWSVNPGLVDPSDQTAAVNVRVQDLVGWQSTTPTPSPASPSTKGAEACTAQPSYPAVPMFINFLAIDGSENAVGTLYQYAIQTDMVGPPAPVVCESVGDTVYNLTWTPNSDSDTVGYGIYIDPIPGQEPDGGRVDAGTIIVCPDAADGADDGGCSTLTIGSLPPDSGSCGSSASQVTCNDSRLVGSIAPSGDAGAPTPSDDGGEGGVVEQGPGGISTVSTVYLYKPTSDASDVTINDESVGSYSITGLVDYVTYTVVVAAVDGMGNVGPPSSEVCDYPAPVADFWTVYEGDGGGKGGYCALETVGIGGPSLVGVAGILFVAAVVRRRRKRR
jgi:hypothetical protein